MKGLFIVLEGIDGSGITTHSKLLVEKLKEKGCKVVYTKEPTNGPIGRIIRELLKTKRPDPKLLSLLFAADRYWHCFEDSSLPGRKGIKGALERGYIVVSDRYLYSSLAYQGKDVGIDWIMNLNKWALTPNVVIYLKIDVDVALRRIRERKVKEYYETKNELYKILETFDKVFKGFVNEKINLIIINEVVNSKELSIEETSEKIMERLEKMISKIC